MGKHGVALQFAILEVLAPSSLTPIRSRTRPHRTKQKLIAAWCFQTPAVNKSSPWFGPPALFDTRLHGLAKLGNPIMKPIPGPTRPGQIIKPSPGMSRMSPSRLPPSRPPRSSRPYSSPHPSKQPLSREAASKEKASKEGASNEEGSKEAASNNATRRKQFSSKNAGGNPLDLLTLD